MTLFYNVNHNTAYERGMPEIYKILGGIEKKEACPLCGAGRRYPRGDLEVRLGRTRVRMWPDTIACGDYPCFVVSDRFVAAMRRCGVRLHLGGKVDMVGTNELGISLDHAPQYFWIDGKRHFAAKMDFVASGYVDVRFCPECGNRTENISLTYDRRHVNPPPGDIFNYDEASGLELFTTDLAPTAFFSTQRVLDCVRENKLTNLAFSPVEQGALGKPVKI